MLNELQASKNLGYLKLRTSKRQLNFESIRVSESSLPSHSPKAHFYAQEANEMISLHFEMNSLHSLVIKLKLLTKKF